MSTVSARSKAIAAAAAEAAREIDGCTQPPCMCPGHEAEREWKRMQSRSISDASISLSRINRGIHNLEAYAYVITFALCAIYIKVCWLHD